MPVIEIPVSEVIRIKERKEKHQDSLWQIRTRASILIQWTEEYEHVSLLAMIFNVEIKERGKMSHFN